MRFTGRLKTWDEARGFGFIAPDDGGPDIFVHVSKLPRGTMPIVGQPLGYEVALNAQGKKQAFGVYVPGAEPTKAQAQQRRDARPSASSGVGWVVAAVLFLAVCGVGYGIYRVQAGRSDVAALASEPPASACDGRTYCSQMTSCREAKYYLKHCPGVKMDGDGDGIPCEQQWCTGVLDQLFK